MLARQSEEIVLAHGKQKLCRDSIQILDYAQATILELVPNLSDWSGLCCSWPAQGVSLSELIPEAI